MSDVIVRNLGRRPLDEVWTSMRRFTEAREPATPDELWFVEHPPVFTLGMNADKAHVLATGDVPVVQIDRGGQVTYHGPGQLLAYVMLDIRRRKLGVRALVEALEASVISTIADYGVTGVSRREAPGVYVDGRKLASLGLRIRRQGCYHGIAINVSMDLSPFQGIDPCGYAGLEVTQLADLCAVNELAVLRRDLEPQLQLQLENATR